MKGGSGLTIFVAIGVLLLSKTGCGIRDYNETTLITEVGLRDGVFVLAYTPGCGKPCDEIEEKLNKFVFLPTNKEPLQLGIGKLNIREEESVSEQFQIKAVPSTVLIKGPWLIEYVGNYESASLSDWITARLNNATEELKSNDDIEKFLRKHDTSMVVKTGVAGRAAFEVVAGGEREFAHYGWFNTDVPGGPLTESKKTGQLLIRKLGDSETEKFDIDLDNLDNVYKIVLENQIPPFSKLTSANIRSYFVSPRPFVWFVGSPERQAEFKRQFISLFRADAFQRKLYWVGFDSKSDHQSELFIKNVFSLDPEYVQGQLIMTDVDGPGRFIYEKQGLINMTIEGVQDFVNSVLNGTAERTLHSEDAPTESRMKDDHGLLRMVSRIFEDTLLDQKEKDTVVYTESPFCQKPECTLIPGYMVALQKELNAKNIDCLQLAVIDGNRNELDPAWNLTMEFPLLWLINKNTNNAKSLAMLKHHHFSNVTSSQHLIQLVANVTQCQAFLQHYPSITNNNKDEL